MKCERRNVCSQVEHLVVNAMFHSCLLFSASEVMGARDKASVSLGLQVMRTSTVLLLTHIRHSRRENLNFPCFQLLSFWVSCFCSLTAPILTDIAWLTAQVSSPALQSSEMTAQVTCTTHLASWTLASQLLHLQSCPLSFQLSTYTCGPHHLHPQLSCLWKNELRQFPAFSPLFSSKSPVT